MSKNKEIPKIKQNLDVKQRAKSGVRELKEFLYSKRASLTQEEIDHMVSNVAERIAAMFYEVGWDDRNEIQKVVKESKKLQIIKMFNEFYNLNINKMPTDVMEEVRYIVDVAIGVDFYDREGTLREQLNKD
jgi:hypothetical protein